MTDNTQDEFALKLEQLTGMKVTPCSSGGYVFSKHKPDYDITTEGKIVKPMPVGMRYPTTAELDEIRDWICDSRRQCLIDQDRYKTTLQAVARTRTEPPKDSSYYSFEQCQAQLIGIDLATIGQKPEKDLPLKTRKQISYHGKPMESWLACCLGKDEHRIVLNGLREDVISQRSRMQIDLEGYNEVMEFIARNRIDPIPDSDQSYGAKVERQFAKRFQGEEFGESPVDSSVQETMNVLAKQTLDLKAVPRDNTERPEKNEPRYGLRMTDHEGNTVKLSQEDLEEIAERGRQAELHKASRVRAAQRNAQYRANEGATEAQPRNEPAKLIKFDRVKVRAVSVSETNGIGEIELLVTFFDAEDPVHNETIELYGPTPVELTGFNARWTTRGNQ